MKIREFGRKIDGKLAVLIAIVGLTVFGYLVGKHHGYLVTTKAVHAEAKVISERERLILAVIVKRNPNATIREFSDFPAFLIDESQKRGLDYRYVMAIIDKESEWNPRAVSPVAGAIGLMQIMPQTGALVAKNAGLGAFDPPRGKDNLGTLGDPRMNVVIGMTHLKGLMDTYGLGPEHLRAYNRGDVAARQHWTGDRYAEDVAFKFVALSVKVPR